MKADQIRDAMIDAAMRLAAERGWAEISLGEIAEAAKVPLSQAVPRFGSKAEILGALSRKLDAAVLAAHGQPAFPDESARDRLFDVLMSRFDALQPYRDGVAAVLRELPSQPALSMALLPGLDRSMGWMLEAAGISADGPWGQLRRLGLAGVWLAALRVWVRDDTPDMAKTMADLDARLRQAQGWLLSLERGARGFGVRRSNVLGTAFDLPDETGDDAAKDPT
ncbi:MAG: TetR family transcriptional regulator [Alphaproteobacteria bacterium]|nr:TetR family transcriptional regulator [Alphaproteobacteria bacterium]